MTTISRADGESAHARSDRLLTVGLVAGLVAFLGAILLPLLPVAVDRPELSWPVSTAEPRSTALHLTTQRPLELDARFDCDTARAAATAPDGLILATMPLRSVDAVAVGLVATVENGVLTVTSRGTELVSGPLPAGPCTVSVVGDLEQVVATVDGQVVTVAPAELALPDVDALTTSAPPDAGRGPDGLSVRLVLDDQFDTVPTPAKLAVTIVTLLAAGVALGALVLRDRRAGRPVPEPGTEPRRWRPGRLRVVDVVVPATMVVWTFLAPMTDDDGYYGAMAANVPATGYVANYYQLYNQGFTPFSWIYVALSWWQSAFSAAPVVLRVPALLLGLATWAMVRLRTRHALSRPDRPDRPGVERAVRIALAVCFLSWWLPFAMGVRPEAVVALAVAAAMVAIAVAVERRRWAPAGLAVAAAAFGFTAAPTGFVALAPLLAGAPAVWRMLRESATVRQAWAGLVAIVAPGALVGVLAFADGSLRDFTRAQEIFLGMQDQETWYSEIVRWMYLLMGDGAMGNYAKRAPVLLGVLAVAVFLVLAAHLRARGTPVPPRLALAGWTTLLGFALLWLTPSKWTHHFGTISGAGAVLLALLMVAVPTALRDRDTGSDTGRDTGGGPDRTGRGRLPALVGVAVLLAALAALAGHGTNDWPYSWMLGIPQAREAPSVGPIAFDQPLWWLLLAGLLVVVVTAVTRRRAPGWSQVAAPIALVMTAALFLTATTVYMVGGFAVAAARTAHSYSPWADAVRDPLARDGAAAQQVEVLDPASARTMTPVTGPPDLTTFTEGGWFPGSAPPEVPGVEVWGSFRTDDVEGPDAPVGSFASPWYAIPADRTDAAMTAWVSGRTGGGNELRVEYGRPGPAGTVLPVSQSVLGLGPQDAPVDDPAWRALLLEEEAGPPPGAVLLRLVAEDTSTAPGGWMALTAPSVQAWTPLTTFLPPERGAVAVGWQFSFLFPGVRRPVQTDGLNEPSTAAVVWGVDPLAYQVDGIFQIRRGGLFAQSLRGSDVIEVVTRLGDFPDEISGQVYLLRPHVPDEPDAYRVESRRSVVGGWSPAPNSTFSQPVQ